MYLKQFAVRHLANRWAVLLPVFAAVFHFLANGSFALPKNPSAQTPTDVQAPIVSLPKSLPLVFDEENFQPPRGYFPAPRSLGISPASQSGVPFVDVAVGTTEHPGGNNRMRRQVALGSDGKVHMIYKAGPPGSNFFDSLNLWLIPYYYNAYNCDGEESLTFRDPRALPLKQVYPPSFDSLLRPRWIGGLGGIYMVGGNIPRAYGNWFRQNINTNPLSFTRLGVTGARDSTECGYHFTLDTVPFAMNTNFSLFQPNSEAINDTLWVATYRAGSNPFSIYSNHTTDGGLTWTVPTNTPAASIYFNATAITGKDNLVYIVSHSDPANTQAFQTTEHPCYVKSTDGGATWGPLIEITDVFVEPGYLANGLGIDAIMVGDTLHVIWTDWNDFNGRGFPGPGGHVWHAAVEPDGMVQGPHKITDINIDGREPDRSISQFGFAIGPWMNVSLSYRPAAGGKEPVLYAFWSQPPDNGNFGFADSTASYLAHLGNFDIFCAASPNNGRVWDSPVNITQTNAPGCNGTSVLCASEDHFTTTKNVFVDDPDTSKWFIPVMALVHAFPGIQEFAAFIDPPQADGGPFTYATDRWRLYLAPARDPIPFIRGEVAPAPGETTGLHRVHLFPRQTTPDTVRVRVVNSGTLPFALDSFKLTGNLNDGQLVTMVSGLNPNDFFDLGDGKNFDLIFNSSQADQGLRSGFLEVYISEPPPGTETKVTQTAINAYVVPTLCINQLVQIESGTNFSYIGTQGSVADQTGIGMYNPASGLTLFYDGGLFVFNSELDAPNSAAGTPRRVTRQLFQDKFLRCASGYESGSVAGSGYQNNFLKTISTDLNDSSLVFLNIWEQSTHPDSSEFLLQTVCAINVSDNPIDTVALGVLYDIDVFDLDTYPPAGSDPNGNQNGDTLFLAGDGRYYQLGWQSGESFIDGFGDYGCGPNNQFYSSVFIPGSTGSPGDTIGPAGAVFYRQRGFSYSIDNALTPPYGDVLAQRYARYITGMCTTEDPACDTLTGVGMPEDDRCDGTGASRAFSDDEGYMAVVKRVFNFPVNGGGQNLVARYGLEGLAASIDSTFSGPGESFTVIHLSAVNGMTELIANARKAVNWYNAHANTQVGSPLTWLKGDLDDDAQLTPVRRGITLDVRFSGAGCAPGGQRLHPSLRGGHEQRRRAPHPFGCGVFAERGLRRCRLPQLPEAMHLKKEMQPRKTRCSNPLHPAGLPPLYGGTKSPLCPPVFKGDDS